MDIQLNQGHETLNYLCKYITKLDTVFNFSIESNQNLNATQQHFRGRTIGSIEAVYDILSIHKIESDKEVLFLDTNIPEQSPRLLRTGV